MKRKKKYRIKKSFIVFVIVVILLIILTIVGINKYKEYKYHQTYEYKLLQKEYSMDEINIIQSKFSNERMDNLLERDYIPSLTKFITEKYFIYKNLDRYLTYYQKNPKEDFSRIVALVNVNRDRNYYEEPIATDTSLDYLMLVNKYYYLDEDYEPDSLENVSSSYAYEGNILRADVYEIFREMCNAAKEDDIILILNSSYRDYKDQDEIWTKRKNLYGIEKADAYAARAGFSEHQTGLALDINEYRSKEDDFEDTDAFKWLDENAYKYGFILRYTKDGEDITGYSYESWHYRYVGKEVAKQIKEENITFDEYYAYYIENEDK